MFVLNNINNFITYSAIPFSYISDLFSGTLIAQSTPAKVVSGDIKLKWSVTTYTTINKQEIYIKKVDTNPKLIKTIYDGVTNSLVVNTKEYTNGIYTFIIKVYLSDGTVIDQTSSQFNFQNVTSTSSSSSISTSTSTSTQTSTKTSTSTTQSKTSTPSSSTSTSISISSQTSSSSSVSSSSSTSTSSDSTSSQSSFSSSTSSTSTASTISNITPKVVELKNITPSNNGEYNSRALKIEGFLETENNNPVKGSSFKITLDEVDIKPYCKLENNNFLCSTDNELVKSLLTNALHILKISYTDTKDNSYSNNSQFTIKNDPTSSTESITQTSENTTISESSSTTSTASQQYLIILGKKIPSLIALAIISIIVLLILAISLPWIWYYLSERRIRKSMSKIMSV